MRGYVVKKGKQYYAVIYEGVDPTTGRERRQWHPGGTVKRDAERLVNELVKRKDAAVLFQDAHATSAQYADVEEGEDAHKGRLIKPGSAAWRALHVVR